MVESGRSHDMVSQTKKLLQSFLNCWSQSWHCSSNFATVGGLAATDSFQLKVRHGSVSGAAQPLVFVQHEYSPSLIVRRPSQEVPLSPAQVSMSSFVGVLSHTRVNFQFFLTLQPQQGFPADSSSRFEYPHLYVLCGGNCWMRQHHIST